MKKQSYPLFTLLRKNDLSNLTTEVKETIAFDLVPPKTSVFTAAELWNIQRQKKSIGQRRFL